MSTGLTIDELAAACGLPSSTIRYYQQQRLVDAPTRAGRRAFYDQRHVEQLVRIKALSERGFSLAAIKQLREAEAAGRSLDDLLHSQTLATSQRMIEMSWEELAERVLEPGQEPRPERFERSIRLGIVEPVDERRVRVHAEALALGSEIRALGIPRDDILDRHLEVRALTDRIAEIMTDLFQGQRATGDPDGGYDRFVVLARRMVELAFLASLEDMRKRRVGAARS